MEKWKLKFFDFYNKFGLNVWEITFIDLLDSNGVTLEKVNDDPNHRGWYYLKRRGVSRNNCPVIRDAAEACEWFDTYIGEVIKTLADAATDYETDIQLENDNLSTRLEAMKADTESLKELHQKNIEDSFGYFQ